MKIKQPPLHQPPIKVIPSFTADPAHNRRELDDAVAKAAELGGIVEIPSGEWPLPSPDSGTEYGKH